MTALLASLLAMANRCSMGFCHIFLIHLEGMRDQCIINYLYIVSLRIYQRDNLIMGLPAENISELHELTNFANVKACKYQLLFVSPESLINSLWREALSQISITRSICC